MRSRAVRLARRAHNPKVVGSNPSSASFKLTTTKLLWFFYFLSACQTLPLDWVEAYMSDPEATIIQLSQEDEKERELGLLSLIETYPEDVEQLCGLSQSLVLKERCDRIRQRPHLSTVNPKQQRYWNGGVLEDRLVLPKLSEPFKPDLSCNSDEPCLLSLALDPANSTKDWRRRAAACAAINGQRTRFDCFFKLSEILPVEETLYSRGVSLCVNAGGFSAECHGHLLFRMADACHLNWDCHVNHQTKIAGQWVEKPKYIQLIADKYWSIVAFKTVGQLQPYRSSEYLSAPKVFSPYHQSALALRLVLAGKTRSALSSDLAEVHLPRVPGPNAPRLSSKKISAALCENGVSVLDIRGGCRPSSTNKELDFDLAWISSSLLVNAEVSQQDLMTEKGKKWLISMSENFR